MGKNPELELPDGRKLARSADSWLRQRSRLLVLPLYIAYLSLSDLSEHLEICKKQGIDVEFVEF